MSYIGFVKKQFKFLKQLGFKVKVYYNWRDGFEVHYIAKQLRIEIYEIGVSVQIGKCRANIFDLGFVDKEILEVFKVSIERSQTDKERIAQYAKFLSENIQKLLEKI